MSQLVQTADTCKLGGSKREKKLGDIIVKPSSLLEVKHLFFLFLLVVEVKEAQEVAVVSLGDDANVVTEEDLLQEFLGQVLHEHQKDTRS